MRTLVISEHHRGVRAIRTLHVEHHRLIVFDREDRTFRLDFDLDDLEIEKASAWELLARVAPAIAVEEDRRDALDALAERCRTGWVPTPINRMFVRQRTLTDSHLAINAIAYPDDEEFYSPATKLLGRDAEGHVQVTGEILWIAADRSYAICDDGLWWLP
jgi:hypothetical protein